MFNPFIHHSSVFHKTPFSSYNISFLDAFITTLSHWIKKKSVQWESFQSAFVFRLNDFIQLSSNVFSLLSVCCFCPVKDLTKSTGGWRSSGQQGEPCVWCSRLSPLRCNFLSLSATPCFQLILWITHCGTLSSCNTVATTWAQSVDLDSPSWSWWDRVFPSVESLRTSSLRGRELASICSSVLLKCDNNLLKFK